MHIISNNAIIPLTREQILARLGTQVKTKAKRSKFERLVASATAQAAHWQDLTRIGALAHR